MNKAKYIYSEMTIKEIGWFSLAILIVAAMFLRAAAEYAWEVFEAKISNLLK